MTRIAIPAAIVMIAVAAFVGAAQWNQSGDPVVTITLTERELELPYRNAAEADDPGLRLRLRYEARYDPLDSRNWLPESRLREIGFSFHVPVGSPAALHTYDHVPARLVWVVFEYAGPEWREIERRRALRAPEPEAPGAPRRAMQSRLVPVDAGVDLEALRRRYPAGHLIMRGTIGVAYIGPDSGGPLLHGVLREVVPPTVAVPHHLKPLFEGLHPPITAGATEPRYEVDLAIGRMGLPYVVGGRRN